MKSILNYLRRLNEALPMLIGTILLYGFVVLIVGIWFFEDKIKYAVGLSVGIVQAIFLSINMAACILDSLDVVDKKGKIVTSIKAILRYLIVVATTFAMCYMNWGYIGTWFAGIMGLKVSALLQPMIHRFMNKKKELLKQ